MFKVKLTIVIVVLSLAVGATGLLYIDSLENGVITEQKALLGQSSISVNTYLSQRRLIRRFLARSIQDGVIPVYLSTLDTFRQEMKQMEIKEWKAYPNRDDASSKAREQMVAATDLPDRFMKELMDKLTTKFGPNWTDENSKQQFLKSEKQRFIRCASIGVDQCVWDYTYNNYQSLVVDMGERFQFKTVSRVIIIDINGFGVADSQDPKWSHVKDYAKKHPLLSQVLSKGLTVEGVDLVREEYYMALAIPLTYQNKMVGLVEVGDPLDEALLHQWKQFAGIDSILVVKGKIAASTVSSKLADAINHRLKGKMKTIVGTTGQTIWVMIPYLIGKQASIPVDMVFLRNIQPVTAPFHSAKVYFSVIIFVLMLIALGFVISFYKSFINPFIIMDQGLHEIVNGNMEYQFPYDFKEKLASTLSNSLNLTMMVVQGKPIPDDEQGKNWDADIADSSGVDLDLSDAEKAALLREPRDKYFERLFKEFTQAREQAGNIEKQDFNKFVQKVVRSENTFKARLDAKEVRMVVVIKGDDVGLYPVPFSAEEVRKFSTDLW